VIAARDAAIKGLPADATDRQKAEAIYYYARDNWTWENYQNTKKGAVGTINAKAGNCCDLTHGIIAIARSAGIRARYVHGPETYYPSGSIWGHVWPELYVDGVWYICDASNNASVFGTPTWDLVKTEIRGKYKDLPF
jgi:transglutaminase-like putative cysteine protease